MEFTGAAEESVLLREGPSRPDPQAWPKAKPPAGTDREGFAAVFDQTGHVLLARRGGIVREVTVSPKFMFLGLAWGDGRGAEAYEIHELLTDERRTYAGAEARKLRGGFICDDGCLHGYWEGMEKGEPSYKRARASGILKTFCPVGGWMPETRDRNRRCADLTR